jgi:hypothetical protein
MSDTASKTPRADGRMIPATRIQQLIAGWRTRDEWERFDLDECISDVEELLGEL